MEGSFSANSGQNGCESLGPVLDAELLTIQHGAAVEETA